jgi:hypothetical protein
MNVADRIAAIESLLKSDGWAIVSELLDAQVVEAARALSDPMLCQHNDSMHFRRGAMWAASRMKDMVIAHKTMLEGVAAMEAAKANGDRK